MFIFIYFIICLIATTIGAISGIGGGVIIKPILDAYSPFGITTINFLSGSTVLAMSITSLLKFKGAHKKFDIRCCTLLAIGAVIGGISGNQVMSFLKDKAINDALIGIVQSAFMIIINIGVFLYVLNRKRIKTKLIKEPVMFIVIGFSLGLMSSFLGIGGGPINIAALHYFFSMDTRTVTISSIYIIFFSQLSSMIMDVYLRNVPYDYIYILTVMILGGTSGGLVGSWIGERMRNETMHRLFLSVLVVITGINIFNIFKYIVYI